MAVEPKQPAPTGIPWRPSFWRNAPWQALAALAGAAICCVGCGVILATSDGKDVATWPRTALPISPSVLLSLMVSVANICLSTALGKGYEIAWWLQALRGAELRRMQFDLQIQQSITALASRYVAIDPFTLAAVVSLAVGVLDGPVIQKATNVTTVVAQQTTPTLSLEHLVLDGPLPANFSSFSGSGFAISILTPVFSNVSRDYANRAPIAMPVAACAASTNTTCQFGFPAPGFSIACEEPGELVPYNFGDLTASGANGTPYNLTVFNATLSFGGSQTAAAYSFINWTTLYKPDSACAGNMVRRRCSLQLATVAYPVSVASGVATLEPWTGGGGPVDAVLSLTNTSADSGHDIVFTGSVGAGGFLSMLGGVYYVLDNLYASTANLRLAVTSSTPYLFTTTGPGQAVTNYLASDDVAALANCTMTWSDPTADMVNTARELMLRSALAYAAANTTATAAHAAVAARLVRVASVYQSLYPYLAATAACMALQMAVTVFLLGGWRRLGRQSVSLDPFEIARALGAPLLGGGGGGGGGGAHASSNSELDDALAPLRRTRLQYGEVSAATAAAWTAAAACMAGEPAQGQGQGQTAQTAQTTQTTQALSNIQRKSPDASSQEASKETGDAGKPAVAHRLGLDRADRVGPIRQGVLY